MDHYLFYVLMPSPTLQPFGLFCFQNFFYIGTRQFTRSFIFYFNSIFVPAVASFSAFISLFLDNGRLVFPLAPYFSLFSPFLQVMAGQVAFQPHVDSFFLLYIYIHTHIKYFFGLILLFSPQHQCHFYLCCCVGVCTYNTFCGTFFQFQQGL